LPDNLSYLASLLRRKQQLTGKVRSALLYPFLVALLTLGLTVFLVCFAFPKIVPLFRGLRTPLPLSTRILIGIEDLLTHHTYMLLTVSLATIVGLTALICLSRLRPYREYLLLRTPLIGPLMRAYYLAVLSRILASLLQSGIPLYTSLTLARAGVQNGEFTEAVTAAEEGVYRGARLSEQLRERDGLFPPSLVGLIVAGEATGSLAASLSTVAELCETELDERTRTLTTLIEPALMILMGVLVGSVALAIVSPIYGITQNISAY
jgi:type IV pilus assembly protein PilC